MARISILGTIILATGLVATPCEVFFNDTGATIRPLEAMAGAARRNIGSEVTELAMAYGQGSRDTGTFRRKKRESRRHSAAMVWAHLSGGDRYYGAQASLSREDIADGADTVLEVVLNEMAGSSMVGAKNALEDAIHIASVIANRAAAGGVVPQEVVSVRREFNGYDIPIRRGAKKDWVLAKFAVEYVIEHGPVHNAMYYATPACADNLPKGLVEEARTEGHIFFSDPHTRPYRTANGYVRPDPNFTFEFLLSLMTLEAPVPARRPLVLANLRSFEIARHAGPR